MKRLKTLISLSLLLTAASADARPFARGPVAKIDAGQLSGFNEDGVDAFLGIPYAAPPVGENRWRAPQPVTPWKSLRSAREFGPSCPQNIMSSLGPYTQEYLPSGATSEDCLTVHVWKPEGAAKNLPVLVWIHGGGFTSGSASVPIYDGAALARQGIVVVAINYRVGFLGSLAAPEFRGNGGGNFGLQDQIEALRWVKRNIAGFGGDPGQVTISGQSAGSFAVHQLIMAPSAKGLFHRANPISGASMGTGYDLWLDTREGAEKSAAQLFAAAGVTSVAEARKLPIEVLRAAYTKAGGIPGSALGFRNKPYADGELLPLDPVAAFKEGKFNDTPVLIGLARDEGAGPATEEPADAARYQEALRKRYGVLAPELLKLYPYQAGAPLLRTINLDARIGATTAWSSEHARFSRFPLYAYVWTHVRPTAEAAKYGAFHTSEVPYIFGTLDKSEASTFTDADVAVAKTMQGYWLNFVKTGNPNGADLPQWPLFEPDHKLIELGGKFGTFRSVDPAVEKLFVTYIRDGHSLFGM
ncbi:MAG: hypothetical protein CVT74_14735 [Alphaproteobacteria bacterium HGW-Alphaproteobacteria-13]|nr:MAG: hypothetical protein CVT74_14735 [Alphaproteobacteria bacterium HGW-Alphaproteobacteria-13]